MSEHPFGKCGYQFCDWPDGELRCNEPRYYVSPTAAQPGYVLAREAAFEIVALENPNVDTVQSIIFKYFK